MDLLFYFVEIYHIWKGRLFVIKQGFIIHTKHQERGE